jgi:hypothetical protein
MPSNKPTVPQTRRVTTFKRSRGFRPLELLRRIAASWRGGATLQRQILNGLQDGRPVYAGTADPRKVAKRRARNRVAARSRRVNR